MVSAPIFYLMSQSKESNSEKEILAASDSLYYSFKTIKVVMKRWSRLAPLTQENSKSYFVFANSVQLYLCLEDFEKH